MSDRALLQVEEAAKHFPRGGGLFGAKGLVRAVDGVSFDIAPGETLGLVGESGSGKSTLGQMIVRLQAPTEGRIRFAGEDIAQLDAAASRRFTAQCQMVFQDPYSSLNPHRTVLDTLARPFIVHGLARNAAEARPRVLELLAEVGLNPPERFTARYPHQMSGGERQRVAIARAVALRPRLVVADEPVSSLDVSVRAQLLNLLKDLQERHGLAYLFITHDLATLRSFSQRVAVMYLGRLVEVGPTEEVITRPSHPYTRALLSAVPLPDPDESRARPVIALRGPIPSPSAPPPGCRFHTRCPWAQPRCAEADPGWLRRGETQVRCIEEVALSAP
jgi:oligopeptide/dipeptide ABC transporter ATP-binding protein